MKRIITSNKVLAVEGNDEWNFFDALFKHIGINDVQIEDVGGKDQFKKQLPAMVKTTGFSDVEIFAVIRDADINANNAFRSVKNILKKEGFNLPNNRNQFRAGTPKVGIYIMPGNSDEGMLEDLCLLSVRETPAMPCVNHFSECCESLDDMPSNLSKLRAQAYLAAMPRIVNCVGLGAQRGYWDFDSQELDDIKSFLSNFQ